ncbi:hypothetical protein ACIBI4_13970 [Streptomyces sp. NPDC050418]|uniref:hypothetical protein n=1 Tax=Streptomyces sp. NPDC050418 TaxID=3365612 RepID=UPI0037B3655E
MITARQAPVVLEEQVCADHLDEVQKALRTPPPPFVRVVWVPQAEGIVFGVSVLGGGLGFGVHTGEVLGLLSEQLVPRVLVEADRDIGGVGFTDDVEPGQHVRQ